MSSVISGSSGATETVRDSKETGQTNPIERLNNTFRQRISRLVRESLSFSKKMENHVGEPFGILSMTTMHSKAKD